MLLGIPLPHRRLSFRGFYTLLNTILAMLSIYQVWSLARLLRPRTHQRRRCVLGTASLCELILGIVAWLRLPRVADAPWSLLRLYVPDLTSWIAAFCCGSFLKCFLLLLARRK